MTDTPNRDAEQDQRHAAVLTRHLDPDYTGEFDGALEPNADGDSSSDRPTAESSLRLLGGDVHRDLYRIEARGKRAKMHQRAATFAHPVQSNSLAHDDLAPSEQLAPGGFRRQHIQRKHRRFNTATMPVTRDFVAFLDLYGSFAGEDLAESDEGTVTDEEEEEEEAEGAETRPLLGRRKSSRIRASGDASMMKSFFTLLKAFIGTGIMFLPKAFKNGGMLFSSITLVTVALVTCLCFHLLLKCRARYGGGYGELGEAIGGSYLRAVILCSITISQIGFVCAGIIFVAENLSAFADAVSPKSSSPISTTALIGIQVVTLIPLSFIRNISKLGPAALLADVFILVGLVYIYQYDFAQIAKMGGFNPTIELFNPRDYTLTIGSAIFTFEGIGLILPIQSSMKKPQQFNMLLYLVMAIITVIFTSVGFLCYGTFGEQTRTEIITNYPQSSKLVNAVQFLYSIAVLVGAPVQLFPAVRILEGKIFGKHSGRRDARTKWKKNALRTCMALLCGLVAAVGAGDLDKFVSLIGSVACVPLVYIYPAYLHFKGVANKRWEKAGDVFLMVVGVLAMVYTAAITIMRWSEG